MQTIERLESEVRSYSRSFPTVFARAKGAWLEDTGGRRYLDFFAGAGALNYGHNNPVIKEALIAYLAGDGVTHSLDMATTAKCRLLESIDRRILQPRDLRYKIMFPGPTGTNAVEAALKLARNITGRTQIVSFTNAFHGMTLGSLAVTGNAAKRGAAGVPLSHVVRAPYEGYLGDDGDTIGYLRLLIGDASSGVDVPAAFLVETVQAEGGVNVATMPWLRRLAALAKEIGALLIIDDIQVGCGRTGKFFSFEEAGITPDVICLSKSLSGYGLPLALTLMRPELDVWQPGEHNGTFRGHNPAFVTATTALETFWSDGALTDAVAVKSAVARARLERLASMCGAEVRGRGLILGMACPEAALANRISRHAFELGMIVETAGAEDQVLKLLPPLTIEPAELAEGLDILERAVERAIASTPVKAPVKAAAAASIKAVAS
jgi:diaminobutyrate-2-oxoglutarate transaminase